MLYLQLVTLFYQFLSDLPSSKLIDIEHRAVDQLPLDCEVVLKILRSISDFLCLLYRADSFENSADILLLKSFLLEEEIFSEDSKTNWNAV